MCNISLSYHIVVSCEVNRNRARDDDAESATKVN